MSQVAHTVAKLSTGRCSLYPKVGYSELFVETSPIWTYRTCIAPLLWETPLEFRGNLWRHKTIESRPGLNWHCWHDPIRTFSHFSRTPTCMWQTNERTCRAMRWGTRRQFVIQGWPKSGATYRLMTILLSNLNRLKNFTGRFLGKIAVKNPTAHCIRCFTTVWNINVSKTST